MLPLLLGVLLACVCAEHLSVFIDDARFASARRWRPSGARCKLLLRLNSMHQFASDIAAHLHVLCLLHQPQSFGSGGFAVRPRGSASKSFLAGEVAHGDFRDEIETTGWYNGYAGCICSEINRRSFLEIHTNSQYNDSTQAAVGERESDVRDACRRLASMKGSPLPPE